MSDSRNHDFPFLVVDVIQSDNHQPGLGTVLMRIARSGLPSNIFPFNLNEDIGRDTLVDTVVSRQLEDGAQISPTAPERGPVDVAGAIEDQRGIRIYPVGPAADKAAQDREARAISLQREDRAAAEAAAQSRTSVERGPVEVAGPVEDQRGSRKCPLPQPADKGVQGREARAISLQREDRAAAGARSRSTIRGPVEVARAVEDQRGERLCRVAADKGIQERIARAIGLQREDRAHVVRATVDRGPVEVAGPVEDQRGVGICPVEHVTRKVVQDREARAISLQREDRAPV